MNKVLPAFDVKAAASGVVSATVATIAAVDADGDELAPGAIEGGTARVALSAWNHSSTGGALPVGVGTVREVGNKWHLEGRFFLDTTAGRETHATLRELLAEGLPSEWSWAYDALQHEPIRRNGRPVRLLKRVRLFEASPVLRGASVGTATTGVKCERCASHSSGLSAAEQAELKEIATKIELEAEFDRFKRFEHREADLAFLRAVERNAARFHYAEVPAPTAKAREGAVHAAREWARELTLPYTPAVRWFAPTKDEASAVHWSHVPLNGFASERTVWIAADNEDPIPTVAHEVGHLAGRDEDGAFVIGLAARIREEKW